ncbi:hypothetical protein G8764_10095 [Pseudomaricurvus alcaniphilus]|uniref:hypothetical protein n=1 Tax=Pseudomaricurvus alcaniphilus TaxID=1166482 RepID=UPI00140BD047|nr:hypothetical protein [Pseudomaricurvus alcaniphilus]NHN37644.1 hypothetical protein [Pseudomaricurvus alcaniphilus]
MLDAVSATGLQRTGFRALLLIVFFTASLNAGAATAFVIPDKNQHSAFLYSDWAPGRANLLVFIDPHCPYCKRAIPKFDGITDYNVYVFWAPIFGERSESTIRPLFHCQRPTSDEILHRFAVRGDIEGATAKRSGQAAQCGDKYDHALRELNDRVVASYPIHGVPAFFVQGVQTSLASVYRPPLVPGKFVNGVALDWTRYEAARVAAFTRPTSVALVLPASFTPAQAGLIDQYRPSYIFSAGNWRDICTSIQVSGCGDQAGLEQNQKSYLELMALLGLQEQQDASYLIAADGRVRILGQ